MNDGAFDDLGGQTPTEDQTDAWDVGGAIYEPCKECGAAADERCTVMTGAGRRERHIPCLSRMRGSPVRCSEGHLITTDAEMRCSCGCPAPCQWCP